MNIASIIISGFPYMLFYLIFAIWDGEWLILGISILFFLNSMAISIAGS
jgi:hypothetical protein